MLGSGRYRFRFCNESGSDQMLAFNSGEWVSLINQRSEPITEPSAVAPDAKLNSEYSVNPSNYHHPNLSLASGATALGSVKPRHLSQVQTDPLPGVSRSPHAGHTL